MYDLGMEFIAADLEEEDPIAAWFAELELEMSVYLGRQNDFTTYLLAKSLV